MGAKKQTKTKKLESLPAQTTKKQAFAIENVFSDFLQAKKEKTSKTRLDPFQEWGHRWGRIGTVIALMYMVAIPFVVLSVYDSLPTLGQVLNVATLGVLAIYVPVGISEALSYTPLLGASSYLAFITGNIMNQKLPVAVNAMKLANKEANTPEGDVVSAIAIAVSSIMTVVILAVAALLLSFISPIFELPAVKTMSNYLLPALFGSMTLGLFASTGSGSRVVKGGLKGVIPVIVLVTLISMAARLAGMGSILLGMVGFLILAMLPVGILSSRILWKKGIIRVVDREKP